MRRWWAYGAILVLLLTGGGTMYLMETGTGAAERDYDQLDGEMDEAAVAAVLGSAADHRVVIRFHYAAGSSTRHVAHVWQRSDWGRPYSITAVFDHDGRLIWKWLQVAALKKFGHWLFNQRAEFYGVPQPRGYEVERDADDADDALRAGEKK